MSKYTYKFEDRRDKITYTTVVEVFGKSRKFTEIKAKKLYESKSYEDMYLTDIEETPDD